MNSNAIIISFVYNLGIASCAAQGAEKGQHHGNVVILYCIANAFGGGFIRDVILLKVHPWLLTSSALPDLALVSIIGFLYIYLFFIRKTGKTQINIALRLITVTDAFGLGSFICIGMDKAFVYSNNIFTIIACGYVTAIGGGSLASGKSIVTIFKNRETIRYHTITVLGCCFYYVFRHSLFLVCFVVISLLLVNIDYGTLYNFYPHNLITPKLEIFLLYPAISNRSNNFQKPQIIKVTKMLAICPERTKIYLMQQRIRQC